MIIILIITIIIVIELGEFFFFFSKGLKFRNVNDKIMMVIAIFNLHWFFFKIIYCNVLVHSNKIEGLNPKYRLNVNTN